VADPVFEYNNDISLAYLSACANLVYIISWRRSKNRNEWT